jgi:hypothetical protein
MVHSHPDSVISGYGRSRGGTRRQVEHSLILRRFGAGLDAVLGLEMQEVVAQELKGGGVVGLLFPQQLLGDLVKHGGQGAEVVVLLDMELE